MFITSLYFKQNNRDYNILTIYNNTNVLNFYLLNEACFPDIVI